MTHRTRRHVGLVVFLLVILVPRCAPCQTPDGTPPPVPATAEKANADKANPECRQMMLATSHVLWLRPDGTVWAAGEDNDGARGDAEEIEYRKKFVQIPGLSHICQIAVSYNSSAALAQDGTVWVWGMFAWFEPYAVPKQIPGLSHVKQIALGSDFLVALRDDGTVAVAGQNSDGVRGVPEDHEIDSHFSEIPLGNDNVAVGATLSTAFAVKRDGSVWGWGSRFGALLGRTSNWNFFDRDKDAAPNPIRIAGLSNIVKVAGGHRHVLALTDKGDVLAWGDNEDGSLGFPRVMSLAETYYQYPGRIWSLQNIVQISAGYGTSAAVDRDGQVWVWGMNTYGCLGTSREFEEGLSIPMQLRLPSPATAVYAGDYQMFAVLKDGTVAGWGGNTPDGSFVDPECRTEFVPPTVIKILENNQ